jgi:hypothetical protein
LTELFSQGLRNIGNDILTHFLHGNPAQCPIRRKRASAPATHSPLITMHTDESP